MAEILPGVHVVQAAQRSAGPGGAMNICLLIEGGKITMVDAGLPGSSAGILAYLDEIGLAPQAIRRVIITHHHVCLLYTSDAADDLLCVDLGGRRIIKK